MTTKHIPVSDPNHVPEILVTGPCNVHIAGHFLVLTCTAARPNVAQIFDGTHQRADVEAIVIARLVFTPDSAAQIAELISNTVANLGKTAGTA